MASARPVVARGARRLANCPIGGVLLGAALVLAAASAHAQPVDVPPTWGGDFWDRPRLTGSW